MNPLTQEFTTPPFSKIKFNHYRPAIERGMELGLQEIDRIASNEEEPTFDNTIGALERSGEDLDRVMGVFDALLAADATDEMMDLAIEMSPRLADYSARISMNEPLFARVKALYDKRDQLGLTTEQLTVLTNHYKGFVRSGALLPPEKREHLKMIKARLSELTTRFGQNVKRELATYRFPLREDQVDGLPDWLLELIKTDNPEEPYVLTLQSYQYLTFMRYSPHDDLRRQLYMLYSSRNTRGEYSNVEVLREIANLRLQMARLLGYETFADFKLERTMAKEPKAVYALLDELREAYRPALERELEQLRDFAGEEITPWNYSYHFNRLRLRLHNFDEEKMRPYFGIKRVIAGIFDLACRLYDLDIKDREDVEPYDPTVGVFELLDADGTSLGLLYADFFPRPGRKNPGAWMTEFREADGTRRPLVNIVMNMVVPTNGQPPLLTTSEVRTFLHEFGHALHALLTRANYKSVSGTNVFRDFVELPSQFNENFLTEPQFLENFARHYETGEPLPQEMIDQMRAAEQFGAAYMGMRQLNFAYLDMAWHTLKEPLTGSPFEFEAEAIAPVRIFDAPEGTLISPSFSHIFAGGYAAGYYSYKWAEVLDADAFSLFQERGVFNPEVAASFRHNILEAGGTDDPAELYRRFRGRNPSIQPLLRRDGLA